jgi:putative FmdB family regulatory protein
MPMYEYECSKCGHRFEVFQKFSDRPRMKCPKCSGAVRKLLSAPAIHFKGSGWYVTDYGRKDGGGAKPSDSGSGEQAKKKSEEVKPADEPAKSPKKKSGSK